MYMTGNVSSTDLSKVKQFIVQVLKLNLLHVQCIVPDRDFYHSSFSLFQISMNCMYMYMSNMYVMYKLVIL